MKKLKQQSLEKIATPAGNPDAGFSYLYTKADEKLYRKQSDGTEVLIEGSGTGGQNTYDAVVSASGDDYTTLSAAIAAGEQYIFVREGIYTETYLPVINDTLVIMHENVDMTFTKVAANPGNTYINSSDTCVIRGGNITFDTNANNITPSNGDVTLENCNIIINHTPAVNGGVSYVMNNCSCVINNAGGNPVALTGNIFNTTISGDKIYWSGAVLEKCVLENVGELSSNSMSVGAARNSYIRNITAFTSTIYFHSSFNTLFNFLTTVHNSNTVECRGDTSFCDILMPDGSTFNIVGTISAGTGEKRWEFSDNSVELGTGCIMNTAYHTLNNYILGANATINIGAGLGAYRTRCNNNDISVLNVNIPDNSTQCNSNVFSANTAIVSTGDRVQFNDNFGRSGVTLTINGDTGVFTGNIRMTVTDNGVSNVVANNQS